MSLEKLVQLGWYKAEPSSSKEIADNRMHFRLLGRPTLLQMNRRERAAGVNLDLETASASWIKPILLQVDEHTRSHAFNLREECLRQKVEGRDATEVILISLLRFLGTKADYSNFEFWFHRPRILPLIFIFVVNRIAHCFSLGSVSVIIKHFFIYFGIIFVDYRRC